MRLPVILFLLFVSLTAMPQKLIRGYAVAYGHGFLSHGDEITITDTMSSTDVSYHAVSDDSKLKYATASSLFFGFPIEYGYARHRLMIMPAVDINTARWFLKFDNPETMPFNLGSTDSLYFKSFTIMPQVGLMYKFHFFAGKLHFAVGAGVDLKIPLNILSQNTLVDNNKTEYDPAITGYMLEYAPASIFAIASSPGIHLSPRVGFDIFMSRFLVINLIYYRNKFNSGENNPKLSGYFGGGVTYLLPFGKEDDIRVLQQYKKN